MLVFLVFLVAGGDPAPHRNEAHYLARLKHYWDPEWCAGDFFLETPEAHFTVVWLFGWVTLFASLEATAWIGRVLTWALLAWGWTRLSRRVTAAWWAGPLSATLLVVLTERTHLAGEWVIGGFEAKCVAYGFVLLALRDYLDDRWNRAWVLLGVASAFHALVGGWSVVALLLAWAMAGGERPALPSMAPGLIVGGLISLLGVAPALSLGHGVDAETVAEAHQIYVFDRLAHHLAPLSKSFDWLTGRVVPHLFGLALFAALARRLSTPPAREEDVAALRKLALFAAGSLAISLAGIAIELALRNHPATAAAVLRYYWFRLADIAPAIASSLMIVSLIGAGLTARRRFAPRLLAVCVGCGVLWVGWYMPPRVAAPSPPADVKMHDKAAWREMCAWVEANTPADSLFLVPRLSHTFKWYTGRPEVVTYKDVPQNAEGLIEWKRRFFGVYTTGEWPDGSPRWADSLAGLGATRLRELGEAYGADYALDQAPRWTMDQSVGRSRSRRASLPVAHRVGPYTLYDLRP